MCLSTLLRQTDKAGADAARPIAEMSIPGLVGAAVRMVASTSLINFSAGRSGEASIRFAAQASARSLDS